MLSGCGIIKGKRSAILKFKFNNSTLLANVSRWLPVILWALVIFILSSISQVKVSEFFIWDYITKKIAHLAEYAVLFVLIFRATSKKWISSFLLLLLYAVSDEIHQHFVPGRNAAILDLGFDLSGANIAGYIIWKLNQTRQKKPRK